MDAASFTASASWAAATVTVFAVLQLDREGQHGHVHRRLTGGGGDGHRHVGDGHGVELRCGVTTADGGRPWRPGRRTPSPVLQLDVGSRAGDTVVRIALAVTLITTSEVGCSPVGGAAAAPACVVVGTVTATPAMVTASNSSALRDGHRPRRHRRPGGVVTPTRGAAGVHHAWAMDAASCSSHRRIAAGGYVGVGGVGHLGGVGDTVTVASTSRRSPRRRPGLLRTS